MRISREIRINIITALVTATLTTAGFLGKEHIDERNRQKQYIGELHKRLYDDGAAELEKVSTAYSDLQSLLAEGYALTTYELETSYTRFQEAITSYQRYIRELERLGNSGQVAAAKNLNEWIIGLYADFNMQYKTAEQVQRRARELLQIENTKSDYFKVTNAALDAELDGLIQNENRIYYEVGGFKMPVIRGLEQHLNYQFRTAIGLEATTDIAKAIKELPELSKRKAESGYTESGVPFVFAQGRAFQAPTLKFEGELDFFERKNEFLRERVKEKFISQVVLQDKALQGLLKERSSAQ